MTKSLGLGKRNFLKFMENGFRWRPVEKSINSLLVQLEKMDKARLDFWSEYSAHLAVERESLADDIKAALWESRSQNITFEKCGRIVDALYNATPLSSQGSLVKAGRFNFAKISTYHHDFPALYIADSYETAFHEKFHVNFEDSTGGGALSGPELATSPPAARSVR